MVSLLPGQNQLLTLLEQAQLHCKGSFLFWPELDFKLLQGKKMQYISAMHALFTAVYPFKEMWKKEIPRYQINRKCEHKAIQQLQPFITCSTEGVVYLLQCPCGLQYVGRTKRSLSVRLNEHVTNILTGFLKHPVSRHYLEVHNRNPAKTIFLGIDRYTPHWRGGSLVRRISRLEMAWVHKLKCYTPFGLNVEVDLNTFIDNS